MYLTYTEYTEMGGTLDETTFNDLEYEARAYVNWYTFNRLAHEEIIPLQVKECIYHIIRLIANKLEALNVQPTDDASSKNSSQDILSQSNDGVSITYNKLSAKDVISSTEDELKKAIDRYLQGVRNSLGRRLLYRGLYEGE